MVALIQTLIAVMLIPIALVTSSAFNDTTHGFAPRGSNSPTIGRSGHLPVSPYGKCGRGTSQHLAHVIPPRLLDLGQYRPLASVAEELNSHVSMEDVARNMVSVELRQSTVVLIASQSLAHVIPASLLDLCQFQGVAGVEEGTRFGCGPEKCCSPTGFCGITKEHCRVGCQSAFGLCDPLSPAIQPPFSH
ncbi:hypothetical protein BASA62_009753 [Batrachochytrium salamandrivorans]|nr:hypothetical protein BASA62_009753 [Batrachochytrium salamandrivorans]